MFVRAHTVYREGLVIGFRIYAAISMERIASQIMKVGSVQLPRKCVWCWYMELHTSNAFLIGVSGTRQLNVASNVLSLSSTCYMYIYICICI